MSTYASPNRAYTESSVMTATREQLVVMLYDGAIRFLAQAGAAMRAGKLDVETNRMRRAEAIIDELNLSLDMELGEVAQQLRGIYLFCKRHLTRARLDRDPSRIDDVSRLLADLRESWQTVAGGAADAARVA
jgi:flagellar protein FliS